MFFLFLVDVDEGIEWTSVSALGRVVTVPFLYHRLFGSVNDERGEMRAGTKVTTTTKEAR
jgi:hypothetical protein